jgi:hypothetical protein
VKDYFILLGIAGIISAEKHQKEFTCIPFLKTHLYQEMNKKGQPEEIRFDARIEPVK